MAAFWPGTYQELKALQGLLCFVAKQGFVFPRGSRVGLSWASQIDHSLLRASIKIAQVRGSVRMSED
jgi:hypothetical protein